MKMKERNLRNLNPVSKEQTEEINSIPEENTTNIQGYSAYSLSDELNLLTMLNTLNIKPQYYRSEDEQIIALRNLIERIGLYNPYFVCQAIIYSRCIGDGMRSINHLAAALIAPWIKGKDWAKRFFYPFNKKEQQGGCIFRPDDMSEIKDAWMTIYNNTGLPNTMREGFKVCIESYDAYSLAKYKKQIIDIANLVHPNPNKSNAVLEDDYGKTEKVLNLIMQGYPVSANTWETNQSQIGQEVAKAIKEGILTEEAAEAVLKEAKADNWEELLKNNKLGILAALRNIRNIMKNPRHEIIDMWCTLISNVDLIKKNLILPIHFDLAFDTVKREFPDSEFTLLVLNTLQNAYQKSIPNLSSIFTGKTCIMVDCSGSMGDYVSDGIHEPEHNFLWGENVGTSTKTCSYKAGLIAATIAKATDADIIKFGSRARRFNYDVNKNVFALAKDIGTFDYGGTNPSTAFRLITEEKTKYDRIIFISDNEVNSRNLTSSAYKEYLRVCSPYVYAIDLAAYGTTPLASNKVAYFYGYGSSLYEDLTRHEFNPNAVIDKVKSIVI